jgi:hypothetical protein
MSPRPLIPSELFDRKMKKGFNKEKVIHRASLVNKKGDVSSLCYKHPRAINLKQASWTNRDDAVTCPKCITLLATRDIP